MENTALVPYTPPLDAAALKALGAACHRIVVAAQRLKDALLEAFAPVLKSAGLVVRCLFDSMLRSVATGREWHYMQHARKARTRKKYRSRLCRRLLTMLAEKGERDDDES